MESLTPQVVASLAKQIRQLHNNPPEGVKFVPSESTTLTELYADIAGPVGTPYDGGLFRVKLVLGSEYPSAPPKGYFLTKIFHPNVSLGGDICVNTLKRDWTPDTTLSHILAVVRCLLIVPFPESSLNDEAGKLFMESYEEYARKARLWTGIHAPKAAPAPAAEAAASSSGSSASASTALSASASSSAAASAGGLLASTGAEVEAGAGAASASSSSSAAAAAVAPAPAGGDHPLTASVKGSNTAGAAAAAGAAKPAAAAATAAVGGKRDGAAAAVGGPSAADAAKKKSMKRL